ncbi:hypothetical protein L249_2322 [Ophiocordyceps polyrhachis-furcata BCC 54312]|uniref:Box C/D snoRNA protein 1 n=1 Tax=Ophiocordyceps polyrhachis-furcata BCC 54312 TaxID=1330021 RepID=A0A367LRK5_9HYPO|nr:hypothetical protein L249_2322 [Ophiocordyceps polyrhachis-furcata BCC 54312]
MADPLLSTLCSVCNAAEPKYTCPRCQRRSCSVECVKNHKARSSCSGKRDETAYVPVSELRTVKGINHDYNFLQKLGLSMERAERLLIEDRGLISRQELRPETIQVITWKKGRDGRSYKVLREKPAAMPAKQTRSESLLHNKLKQLGIEVVRAPKEMTRRKENKTIVSRRSGVICWQVEWLTVWDEGERGAGMAKRVLSKVTENMDLGQAYRLASLQNGLGGGKEGVEVREEEPLADWWLGGGINSSTMLMMQEPSTGRWIDIKEDGDDEEKTTTTTTTTAFHFFLGPPLTGSAAMTQVTAVDPGDTLRDVLPGTKVAEFPTIYVLRRGQKFPPWLELKPRDEAAKRQTKRKAVGGGGGGDERRAKRVTFEQSFDDDGCDGMEEDVVEEEAGEGQIEDGEMEDEEMEEAAQHPSIILDSERHAPRRAIMDDGPVPKLSDLLRHPEDLDKIPALKLEFSRKKGAVDSQLRTGLREQLDTTQAGMTGLGDGQKTVQLIKDEMINIDRLCSESQTMIRDFASINLVSQAHRNFGAVEAMRRDLESFSDRLLVVEDMLRQDDDDKENMPNLLPCHYELTQLRNMRDDATEQVQRLGEEADPGLATTLDDYFGRLDETIDWFDEHVGILAMNLISLVVNENNGLVVRFAVVMDAEERSDRRVLALQEALRDHQDMAARFRGITDGPKKVRGYKQKFIEAIRIGAEQQLEQARDEFLDDASRLDKAMKWYYNDLNAVKMGMTPLVPRRWNVTKTYVDVYHGLMHDFLVGMMDDGETSSAHTLEIASFPEKYYKKMAKLGFRPEDLTPHVIDNREAELVDGFRKLIVKFLDEWIDRILAQEKRDLAERGTAEGSNLDQDEYGYFRTKNLVALWRMLREQVDAAANSERADVVEGVVDAMFLRLRGRQQAWQRMLEDEATAACEAAAAAAAATPGARDAVVDGFQALQDWLVATANDQIACVDDNEDEGRLGYLSSFRQKVESSVTAGYLERADDEVASLRDGYLDLSTWCINRFAQLIFAVDFKSVMSDFFTPRWYSSATMKQISATFDEYVSDYRQVLHHSLVDIFVEILADELLVRYLSCVRNKGAKFRRSDPFRDKIFADVATAFDFFASLPNPDVGHSIKQTWRVTEPFLRLLDADRDSLPDAFADFKAAYWDLNVAWVEAVLRSRDDFDRAMLNAVLARAAQIDLVRGPETIMGRVK